MSEENVKIVRRAIAAVPTSTTLDGYLGPALRMSS